MSILAYLHTTLPSKKIVFNALLQQILIIIRKHILEKNGAFASCFYLFYQINYYSEKIMSEVCVEVFTKWHKSSIMKI